MIEVGKAEFLALPPGTVYSRVDRSGRFQDRNNLFEIKGDTLAHPEWDSLGDWYVTYIETWQFEDGQKSLFQQRDAMYSLPHEESFLIYDAEEVRALAEVFRKALKEGYGEDL